MPQALGEVAGPAKTVPEIAIRAMVSKHSKISAQTQTMVWDSRANKGDKVGAGRVPAVDNRCCEPL
ncbi:MAG: hypothetical protein DCC53_15525 [Chloroflexi bacterium]|nr:MAG: hypothetical protein DCC53_15525 [Chloroflexota bacterium]